MLEDGNVEAAAPSRLMFGRHMALVFQLYVVNSSDELMMTGEPE